MVVVVVVVGVYKTHKTYLVGHDDKGDVWSAALVEGDRIGNVETALRVPFTHFGQILALQFEQIERDVVSSTFFKPHGARQSSKFHLFLVLLCKIRIELKMKKIKNEGNDSDCVDVIEEGRSVIPRLLDVARKISQAQGSAAIKSRQTVSKSHDTVVHQGRFSFDYVGLVENPLTDGLELFHITQQVTCAHTLSVHHPEGGNVYKIVLEIFQIKSLQIL